MAGVIFLESTYTVARIIQEELVSIFKENSVDSLGLLEIKPKGRQVSSSPALCLASSSITKASSISVGEPTRRLRAMKSKPRTYANRCDE